MNNLSLKKTSIVSVLSSMLLLWSCQNNLQDFDREIKKNNTKLEKVVVANIVLIAQFKSMGIEEKRVAYSLLSKHDKHFMWKEHIKDFIRQNQLTQEQQSLVDELENKLSIEVFGDGDAQKKLLNYLKNDWGKRALVLRKGDIDKLVNLKNVGDAKIQKQYGNNGRVETKPNCDCTPGVFINDCGDIERASCTVYPGGCEMQSDGCGWFGWETCDMKCVQISKPSEG